MNHTMQLLVTIILVVFIFFLPYFLPVILVIGLYYLIPKIVIALQTIKDNEHHKPIRPISLFISITPEEKQDYLKSTQWNTLRKSILLRDNYTCRKCTDSGIPLEVHHIHYRTFKRETGDELVSVCRECHQSIHNKYGYMYTSTFPIH